MLRCHSFAIIYGFVELMEIETFVPNLDQIIKLEIFYQLIIKCPGLKEEEYLTASESVLRFVQT